MAFPFSCTVACMSIALSEFWTRIVRVGITDSDGCKKLAKAYTQAHNGTPPSDSKDLAKFLIHQKVLTKFQAKSLLAAEPRSLRIGEWVIVDDRAPSPLSHWVRVQGVKDQREGVLIRASAEALSGGRDQWLQAHGEISAETLQSFECEPQESGYTIFSPLPSGNSLAQISQLDRMSPREVIDIGIAVSRALEAMHARPLVHGGPRLDRVWITKSGSPILLRDPSGPPANPWEDASGSWLDGDDSPASYAAPEFSDATYPCDVATDLYSLGCLLFRLLTGRPPVDATDVEEAIRQHATETPPELVEAVAQGQSGDPLFRVLAYAMAKSPEARFSSAGQLTSALEATRGLVSDTPVESATSSASATAREATASPKSSSKSSDSAVRSRSGAGSKKQKRDKTTKSVEPKSPSKKTKPVAAKPSDDEPNVEQPIAKEPTVKPEKSAATSAAAGVTSVREAKADSPVPAAGESSEARTAPPQSDDIQRSPDIDVESGESTKPAAEDESAAPATVAAEPPAAPVSSEPPRPSRRRRKKKDRKAPIVLGGMCVVVLILLIGLIVPKSREVVEEPRQRPRIPEVIPRVTNQSTETEEPDAGPAVPGYQLVSDDRLLFVPPYGSDTAAPSLEMLPPGPAVIVSWRVDSIRSKAEAQALIEALSPELEQLLQSVSNQSKISLDEISRCTVALHPGTGGWPEVTLSVQLAEPRPKDDLVDQWQVAASRTTSGATIYAGDSVDSPAYYLPKTELPTVTRFTVGSIDRISEVAEGEGGAIPLPRTLAKLWEATSEQADLVAMVTPNFLFADGREMLKASLPELVPPLKSVLIPDVAAAVVSVDIDDGQYYVEARISPSGGVSEGAMLQSLQKAIDSWPQWAEDFIVTSIPEASWRLLATRLPAMMRFVSGQFRYGINDGVVIANTYLPAEAAPQLSVAVTLAMNTTGQSTAVVSLEPVQTLTVEEMLDRPMSVSFDQESLEFAIDAVVEAFKSDLPKGSSMPPVQIVGGDLELSGITQNQQVRDFSKEDLPLRKVLTDLVVGANPDPSTTGPSDPKQALIWVVSQDESGQEVILITTRPAAATNQYQLPPEFVIAGES